ncbi:acyl-CoA carboxylase subunit epsilon [Microbacterium sp. G2-8]|uniref:acyl-CoA carboxylase subunit epsilon n=1 Tax=Microbacterium sp. G2-8 TaxID=2842454 RepID=UPI001C89DC4C|nr:acyl-CoA carboxylase subunit epsilon [Microbacterium sp. G2-8]
MTIFDPGASAPAVRITGGNPTDEELAAVVAVVSEHYAQEAQSATAEERRVDSWSRSRRLRRYARQPWGRFAG